MDNSRSATSPRLRSVPDTTGYTVPLAPCIRRVAYALTASRTSRKSRVLSRPDRRNASVLPACSQATTWRASREQMPVEGPAPIRLPGSASMICCPKSDIHDKDTISSSALLRLYGCGGWGIRPGSCVYFNLDPTITVRAAGQLRSASSRYSTAITFVSRTSNGSDHESGTEFLPARCST
ncbi:hypothetical protein D3C74_339520 [compost metagenome]